MSGTTEVGVRLILVLSIGVVALVLVWSVKRFIDRKRQHILAMAPATIIVASHEPSVDEGDMASTRVRILAFSSEDCKQCHTLQAPVLRRVKENYGDIVTVVDIDAPSSPELTERYHVLTVPTTVLLDIQGKAHAVNYGFTNAQSLIKQVDEILSLDTTQEALSGH